jgi:acetyl/propionyl-CoA carboxylase alpha subunit
VREDRGFEAGSTVTPFYDGMIAKLIVWGPTRDVAIARALRALHEYRLDGLRTNLTLLEHLLACEPFRQVGHDTGFVERELKAVLPQLA